MPAPFSYYRGLIVSYILLLLLVLAHLLSTSHCICRCQKDDAHGVSFICDGKEGFLLFFFVQVLYTLQRGVQGK